MSAKDTTAIFNQTIGLDDHDNSTIKRSILDCTKAKYDRALRIFDKFVELHPKARSPPNIQPYNGFMEFVARNMKGRIGKKPTVGTMDSFHRDFEAGLVLQRDHKTPESITTTIREFIQKDLKEKVPLCTEEIAKDGLSPNDLTIVMPQLWCTDFKEYGGKYSDCLRIQLSAEMLLYCFTSARTGEVLESTACRDLSRRQEV